MPYPVLTIIVPCFNEEAVFKQTQMALTAVLSSLIKEELIDKKSKLLFVDDGSTDQTWVLIEKSFEQTPLVAGLKLSKNFGHQKALLAGLETAVHQSDCMISVDADLQDDIEAIRPFVLKYLEGYDVVYGVRACRDTDTAFKKWTAQGFYKLMKRLGMNLVYNHADYRLLSQRAVLELLKFKETHLFLRGIVPLVGFQSTKIFYERKERAAGESKYPFKKMIAFALDGMTSFSVKPIRLITLIGIIASIISFIVGVYALSQKFLHQTQLGWTSLITSIWFIGGLMLMSIGLVGEYIGKIYEEVKQRPRFIIEENLFTNERKNPVILTDRSSTNELSPSQVFH
jgi:polyisoprenyl-phosphate glycosyltransferase